MSRRQDLNLLQTRIKRMKKARKLKACTEQMREELNQLTNLVENRSRAIVQAREAAHQLFLAAEALDAQVLQFISVWLDKTDGD